MSKVNAANAASGVALRATKGTASTVSKVKYDGTIGKTKAASLIQQNGYKIFNATYVTLGGKDRNITCRLGVKPTTKSKNPSNVDLKSIGMLRVYDMIGKGYKTVNLQTLKSLKIQGKFYKVK